MRVNARAPADSSGLSSCFAWNVWIPCISSAEFVCGTEQKLFSDLAGSSAQCVCLAAAKSQGTELQEERQQL